MGLTDLMQDALPPGIMVTVERFGEHQLTTCCEFISSSTHLLNTECNTCRLVSFIDTHPSSPPIM